MRVLVQRVLNAKVEVHGKEVGKVNNGLLLFVGFTYGDTIKEIDYLVDKVINLRIFDDSQGVMNKSLIDVGGEVLSVSQFTLYADTAKGRRPSYANALDSQRAKELYDTFNQHLIAKGIKIETGCFGEDMKVTLTNDGPVTIMLEK